MFAKIIGEALRTQVYRNAGDWAAKNRKLSRAESSEPGFFNIERTPYLQPIYDAAESGLYSKIVLRCGSQMGKTEFSLNRIGYRMDTSPAPCLVAVPTKDLARRFSKKRIDKMLRNTASLKAKTSFSQRDDNIFEKQILGTSLRLAWCTSASQLCSEPFAEAHLDELNRCEDDVDGEGDPISLIEARGATYPDFLLVIASTPTFESGPIDRAFEEGTRQTWHWLCPKCGQAFAPKFSFLEWPEKASDDVLLRETRLVCPCCDYKILDIREDLNKSGLFLAPEQKFDGSRIIGELPRKRCASFHISGLCSPWQSFGERAIAFQRAKESGDQEKIKAVINTCFGESYKLTGEAPKWEEIYALRERFDIPKGVVILVGVDVQRDRFYYVARAFAVGMESWLVSFGEIYGDTEQETSWVELKKILDRFNPRAIVVDCGFREYAVYDFARRFPNLVYPAKGQASRSTPVHASKIEYSQRASRLNVRIWLIDDGFFKEWIHGKIRGTERKWHIPFEINEDYCRHIVAEQLVVKPSGKKIWIKVSKRNDYLDCEKLATAGAYILGLQLVIKNRPAISSNARPIDPYSNSDCEMTYTDS